MNSSSLIEKYNVPGPRYTSYPTVPYWSKKTPSKTEWADSVRRAYQTYGKDEGLSIYIHLPYCESLCTYCACNTRITVNHKVEEPYIKAVVKEWMMYLNILRLKPTIKDIHLGGGTPTFFSPNNLRKLIRRIKLTSFVAKDAEFSFEAHPANTSIEHLETLYKEGFRRLSLGIQDFDLRVQIAINRIQKYEQIRDVTEWARKIGYNSINYDLIYGLPFQTKESITETIAKVCKLRPDRIAFYSYAHVPWKKPGQRRFTDNDLPSGKEKRELYVLGLKMLKKAGYQEIGMDHFALKSDLLHKASLFKKLHRNFMGYTYPSSKLLIGLGVSAISDSWFGFNQNEKTVEKYLGAVGNKKIPTLKGHILSQEDLIVRRHILNVMCELKTSWHAIADRHPVIYDGIKRLKPLVDDDLLSFDNHSLKVTERGRPFLRNICMAMDARLWRRQPSTQVFSSII